MFNAPKLTNAGKALYYDNMAGTQIVFTTIQLGSGNISGPIPPMTALVTPVVTIDAEAKSVSGQYAEISCHFSNAQLADGFYFREIGVFAADPDYPDDRSKDILYCYQNAYDTADFIPVASVETVEKNITIPVIIGDATAVSCTLSRSLILASMEDLDNHNANQNAHGNTFVKAAEKGKAGGVATLDSDGILLKEQRPKADGLFMPDGSTKISEKINAMETAMLLALAAAAPYSTSQTYALGAYCTRDGKLYKANQAISAAEEWTVAHWTETTMGAELVTISIALQNKADKDRAVNKAGDTMTGKLFTSATESGSFGASTDSGALRIDGGTNYDKGAFLTLFGKDAWQIGVFQLVAGDGEVRRELKGTPSGSLTWDNNTILHTGNKPSGSYTGNGSSVERTIEVGGFGDAIFIRSTNDFALVCYNGAILKVDTSVSGITKSEVKYENGVLTMKSTKSALNTNGVIYYYQVL